MKKVVGFFCVLILAGAFGTPASALPLPPSPWLPPVSGESDLYSFTDPSDNINVDWTVVALGDGTYKYMYQLENASSVDIDDFSITMANTGSILSVGVEAGDLDSTHVLAEEEEGFTFTSLTGVTTSLTGTTVKWRFDPLAAGSESNTLFFISTHAPIGGNAVASNDTPPSPWGSLAPGGDEVPVPTPEPATLFLFGVGLAGLGAFGRKQITRLMNR